MYLEVPRKGAFQRETNEGGPSTCVGIPTVNLANNEVALYYDMDPPGCWRRLRVFFKGLIYGLTFWLCLPVVKLASDDLTWGRRLSTIGIMLGSAIVGVIIGFVSAYFGCWAGSEIAVCIGDENDDSTGCNVGGWSSLAIALCLMILAGTRGIPKSVFRSTDSAETNKERPETEPYENE